MDGMTRAIPGYFDDLPGRDALPNPRDRVRFVLARLTGREPMEERTSDYSLWDADHDRLDSYEARRRITCRQQPNPRGDQ